MTTHVAADAFVRRRCEASDPGRSVPELRRTGVLRPLLPIFLPIDAASSFVLICAYTGKEVVECKVLMAVVEVTKDQVRWLRLRAGCSERGF
jgi:hypothetical protein